MGDHIGYIRVSTVDQNTDRQLADIHLDRPPFKDKISGKSADRPELKKCLDFLRDGDTLHIHSMDRLARNLMDLQTIVDKLTKIGVTVIFHKENLTFDGSENPIARMMLQVMGSIAEFERSLIRERQREGIALALKKGVKFGPKPMVDDKEKAREIYDLLQAGKTKTEVASIISMSRTTLYKFIRKYDLEGIYNSQTKLDLKKEG